MLINNTKHNFRITKSNVVSPKTKVLLVFRWQLKFCLRKAYYVHKNEINYCFDKIKNTESRLRAALVIIRCSESSENKVTRLPFFYSLNIIDFSFRDQIVTL